MTLRRSIAVLLVAILGSPTVACAANFKTDNFIVDAPTAELARKFGEWAEYYRKEKAMQWLGKEMPPWPSPCPIKVQITMGSAGGATTFQFDNVRPVVTSQSMEIFGEAKRLLYSVLPHEITHTVLAYHFGRPVPRWADEGGSVLSENDEERFNHDVRCRELLNDGRAFRLRVLFQMAKYPNDMMVLYAQGYSVCAYLVDKGGPDGRAKLLRFLGIGMQGSDSNRHGSMESWNEAARQVYQFETVDAMEGAWLQALKTPPSRTAARETGSGSGMRPTSAPATFTATPTAAPRTEFRTSAAPALPVLEPPVKARAAAPESDAARPTYLPPAASTLPAAAPARTTVPDVPPPVLLPPEIPRPTRE